jgi:hypothetical protein
VRISRVILFAALGGLVLGGVYALQVRSFHAGITVIKVASSAGGSYSITGHDYQSRETVSVEIKNAPLASPGGWQLGTACAVQGRFSFQTENFQCVHVDDPKLREQYAQQRVIFVATGLNSGYTASRVETAGGIFVCQK